MSRSVGVTAAAFILVLAGAFLLIPAGYTMMEAAIATTASNSLKGETNLAVLCLFYVTALLFLAAPLWCIATSIGLFRLRSWARRSIILLSIVGALFSVWTMRYIPEFARWSTSGVTPQEAAPLVSFIVKMSALAISVVPLLICVWWLILFTRPSVKRQFSV